MNGPSVSRMVGAALVAGWLLLNQPNAAHAQPPLAAPPNDLPPGLGYENIDVLTRGPLHEAFAEQFTDEPTPGLIVNRQPPEPIDEVPPDYRPEGANVEWIPGYWGWDIESEDFIWITGIWRDVPPRQRFIPGYWTRADNGWQWISGFWTLEQTSQLEYLPYPPEAVDSVPSSEPPTTDHFWVPGQWSYVNQQYRWRAGYWSVGYDDWVWIPDRYVWTPYGCVFRPGYWDYVLTSRGTVFCPIRPRVVTVGFRFQPTYVVDTGVSLLVNLFVQPRYHHYCFGDYYGDTYVARNIYPWVSYHTFSRRYDPLYSYYRFQYRETSYVQRIARWHDYFHDHRDLRPPRDLAGQARMATRVNGQYADYITRAHSLRTLADRPGDHHRYSRLDRDDLARVERYASPLREISRERSTWETLHRGEFDRDRGRTEGVDRRPDFARDAREPRDRDDRRNDSVAGGREQYRRALQLPQQGLHVTARPSADNPGRDTRQELLDQFQRLRDSGAAGRPFDRSPTNVPRTDQSTRGRYGDGRDNSDDRRTPTGSFFDRFGSRSPESVGNGAERGPQPDRTSIGRPFNERPANGRPVNERTTNERTTNERTLNDRTIELRERLQREAEARRQQGIDARKTLTNPRGDSSPAARSAPQAIPQGLFNRDPRATTPNSSTGRGNSAPTPFRGGLSPSVERRGAEQPDARSSSSRPSLPLASPSGPNRGGSDGAARGSSTRGSRGADNSDRNSRGRDERSSRGSERRK